MRLQNLFEAITAITVKQFRDEPIPDSGICNVYTYDYEHPDFRSYYVKNRQVVIEHQGIADIILHKDVSDIHASIEISECPQNFYNFMRHGIEQNLRNAINSRGELYAICPFNHFDDDAVQDVLDHLQEQLIDLANEFTAHGFRDIFFGDQTNERIMLQKLEKVVRNRCLKD